VRLELEGFDQGAHAVESVAGIFLATVLDTVVEFDDVCELFALRKVSIRHAFEESTGVFRRALVF
jgi:hypothetical protein